MVCSMNVELFVACSQTSTAEFSRFFFSAGCIMRATLIFIVMAAALCCSQAAPRSKRNAKDDDKNIQTGGDPAYDSQKLGTQNKDGTPKIGWDRVVHFLWKGFNYMKTAWDTLTQWWGNGLYKNKDGTQQIQSFKEFNDYSGPIYDVSNNLIFDKQGPLLNWFSHKQDMTPLLGRRTHVHDENKSADKPPSDQSYTEPPAYKAAQGSGVVVKAASLALAVSLANVCSMLLF